MRVSQQQNNMGLAKVWKEKPREQKPEKERLKIEEWVKHERMETESSGQLELLLG